MQVKAYEDAVSDLDEVIRLKPTASAYGARAGALGQLGNYGRTVADLKAALQIPAKDEGDRRAHEMARQLLARLSATPAPTPASQPKEMTAEYILARDILVSVYAVAAALQGQCSVKIDRVALQRLANHYGFHPDQFTSTGTFGERVRQHHSTAEQTIRERGLASACRSFRDELASFPDLFVAQNN
jgi:hypothetical protein